MKNLLILILALVILAGGWLYIRYKDSTISNDARNVATTTDSTIGGTDVIPTNTGTVGTSTATSTQQSTDIVVTSPHSGDLVKSPITVTGKAKGSWYFEASAPVKVYDSNGKLLGTSHVQAQGEWMTTDFVPFVGTINFATSTTPTGTIVFMNDNPSGDPARSKSYTLPIRFK